MNTTEKGALPALTKEASKLETQANEIAVKDEKTLAYASDRIKAAKDLAKRVKAEKERFTAPAKEIISAAKAKYDPILAALEAVERTLKNASEAFLLARMKKQREEEAKIAARVEKGTLKTATAMKKLDELGDDANAIRTEHSGLRVTMRKDIEVVALEQVGIDALGFLAEQGYLVWDMVKVRKDALAGIEIPGVKIIEKPVTQSV